MVWQLLQVQTVTSAARKLAVPTKFQNIVTWPSQSRPFHFNSDHSIMLV